MAKKRFTDIEIWDKEWYMELIPKHKCLMKYIFDKCDASGCWKPNWKLASLHINDTVDISDLSALPDEQYEILFSGKIFIPDFINFQYGTLSEKSPAHNPVFLAIEKNNLSDRVFNRVQSTPKETDIDKEEEKEKEKESQNLWFLKFYHSNYDHYKSIYNGQSASEENFKIWKSFIDLIYEKELHEIFHCNFINPKDFGVLVEKEKFTNDKWEEIVKSILATGVKKEHNLLYRIPQFMKYQKTINGTNKQSNGVTKFNAGALELLEKGKREFDAIARKQSSGT